jgi:hypothetical protein
VSFADSNVLHPPDAFTRLLPGALVTAGLDLSFAFDRRGAGRWPISFAYETVRAAGGLAAFAPPGGTLESGVAELVVTTSRSLREAGIDEALENALDEALLAGNADLVDRVRALGTGGTAFLVRRIARILSTGAEATIGWRALDVLSLLGREGANAARLAIDELPHAAPALEYATGWTRYRAGSPPDAEHAPFVAKLDELIASPEARESFVLSWAPHDSLVHGARRLEIFGDGTALVTRRLPGEASVPTTRKTRLDEGQLTALLSSLRYAAVWLLRPLRERGMPDEPRPALEVQLTVGDPFARRVTMWNGEWREGPARHLADLLDRVAS